MSVTMTDNGPRKGHIALEGLLDREGLVLELSGAYECKGAQGYSGEPLDRVDRLFAATGDFINATLRIMPLGDGCGKQVSPAE